MAHDVPVLTQSLQKALDHEGPAFARAHGEKTDPGQFLRSQIWRLPAGQEADTNEGQADLQELATAVHPGLPGPRVIACRYRIRRRSEAVEPPASGPPPALARVGGRG